MKKKEKIKVLKREISELRAKIFKLQQENFRIRKDSTETKNVKKEKENFPDSNMNLEKIFEHCYFIDNNGAKTKTNLARVYNALTKNQYQDLKCLEGKRITEILKIKNIGNSSIAILIIICNHYGVKIIFDGRRKAEEEKIKVLMSKYEERIYFTD